MIASTRTTITDHKRAVRRLSHIATALLLLPLLYLAAAGLGALLPGGHIDLPQGRDVTIGLLRGPIHYDLLLPLSPDLRARYDFDVVGHYARPDVFSLKVDARQKLPVEFIG